MAIKEGLRNQMWYQYKMIKHEDLNKNSGILDRK